MSFKIFHGDCLETLKNAPDNSIDSIVTDPPYGLSFMGKKWDYDVPSVEIWKECLRVLKPGGHLLAFGGTRTYHRLVVAIEDAGFEIRDQIQWIYGQGFPKSMDVAKALDKEFECQSSFNVNLADVASARTLLELREEKTGSVLGHVAIPPEAEVAKLTVIGKVENSSGQTVTFQCESESETCLNIDTLWKNTSDDPSNPGKKFITETKLRAITGSKILNLLPKLSTRVSTCGTGTALKPANEPICLARKPLSEATIAKNVLKHGTGGLNIDGTRVGTEGATKRASQEKTKTVTGWTTGHEILNVDAGRFPSNVILDEDAAKVLDEQSGISKSSPRIYKDGEGGTEQPGGWKTAKRTAHVTGATDSGGASRFFKVIGDEECSANTAKQNLNPLSELDDFVQRLVAISESPDTSLRSTLLAFTSEMQSELNNNGANNITTIQNTVERFLHELQLTDTLTNDPAISAEVQTLTDTTKTIQNLLKSSSCVAAATSSTMSKSKELGGQDLVGSRFLYQAKASKSDRGEGNTHPTVKPIKLMEYLIKLVTPEGGKVLDPFMGSGTTGVAAVRSGFDFRGIEREEQYYYIAQARLEKENAE